MISIPLVALSIASEEVSKKRIRLFHEVSMRYHSDPSSTMYVHRVTLATVGIVNGER